MIEIIGTFILPSVDIHPTTIFEDAHLEDNPLGHQIVEAEPFHFSPAKSITIVRIMVHEDMDTLRSALRAKRIALATLWQIVPLAYLPEFRFFEEIYALGSHRKNESVPFIFLPKRLDKVRESETYVARSDRRYHEIIQVIRGGRWIGADIRHRFNSKGMIVASVS